MVKEKLKKYSMYLTVEELDKLKKLAGVFKGLKASQIIRLALDKFFFENALFVQEGKK